MTVRMGASGLPILAADDPKKPYGDVAYADPGYQEDGVSRYPIDTEEHCRAAWSYINQEDNAARYTPDQLAKIKATIRAALKKYGVEIAEDSIDPKTLRMSRPVAQLKQGRTDWYRISNKTGLAPEVYIYDEIGYWGVTASDFGRDLQALDADALTIHINSPGGEVYDGLAIYQSIRSHRASVTVIVDGLAASAASFIAMAADKLVMAPKSSMMIHDGFTMAVGNAADLRKTAELLDKASQNIASIYADRSGLPTEFWRERMLEETWYSAQEAVDAGLADEVEGQAKSIDNSFDLSVFAHAGRDRAPAPVIKAAPVKAKEEPVIVPAVESKVEPEFTWDFAAFKSSLKEGLTHG